MNNYNKLMYSLHAFLPSPLDEEDMVWVENHFHQNLENNEVGYPQYSPCYVKQREQQA